MNSFVVEVFYRDPNSRERRFSRLYGGFQDPEKAQTFGLHMVLTVEDACEYIVRIVDDQRD